jgi:hypothetical protein
MDFYSSREDLKRGLGTSYFLSEYSANTRSDLTWSQLQAHLVKDQTKIYSDNELLLQEEKLSSQQESKQVKAVAMGLLPLVVSEDIIKAFQSFSREEISWIEIDVLDEMITVTRQLMIPRDDQKLVDLIDSVYVR